MSPSIALIRRGMHVAPLLAQLDAHREIWDQHRARTEQYASPHTRVSDIWVRYNPWRNFAGDLGAFNGPHIAEWYPVIEAIPAVVELVQRVISTVEGRRLGGVLITRIPPGGRVEPHVDRGWHAAHYEKFAVQLRGDERQAFCFEDSQLSPLAGDLYTFDNSRLHWVTNDSDVERITLICCIRRTDHE